MNPVVIANIMSLTIEPGAGEGGWDAILLWALTEENESVLFRIENYPSTFYFEFDNQQQVLDLEFATTFHDRLRYLLGENAKHLQPLKQADLSKKMKLYYGVEVIMLKLAFATQDAARHAKNILAKGIKVDNAYNADRVYGACHETEQSIDIYRKLLSDTGIAHCGWFSCSVQEVTQAAKKMSTRKHEYIVNYKTMKPVASNAVPRPLWLDFDLEVYSHNHDQFPRKWNAKDVIHTVSMIFRRDGDTQDKWIEYVVCTYPYIIEDDDIDTVTIIQVADEAELIVEYARLILLHDPDLIGGYNINQFDNGYLEARIARMSDSWPIMGRLKGRTGVAKNICWSSNAYRDKDMYIPPNSGRQYLDIYEHITRSMQLSSYSLENVARTIFPDDPTKRKQDVSPKKQFEIYKAVVDARRDGTIEQFYQAEEQEHGSGDDATYRVLADAGRLIRYCIFDSRIVGYTGNKIFFWVGVREMCNTAGAQPEGLLTRGQQYKVSSLLYHSCQAMNIVRDKQENLEQFYYRGGLVQKPVVGHSEQVMLMDFQSLYPNVMIAHNLCYTTLIPPDKWDLWLPHQYEAHQIEICNIDPDKEGEEEIDAPVKSKKQEIIYRTVEVRFLKKEVREGVLPTVLRGLLDARAAVRSTKTEDKSYGIVLNQRQLALKINANSVYGFTGVRAGNGKGAKAQCLWVTATTCFLGRSHITGTIEWMIAKYNAKLIYGDTDSCMMQIAGGLQGDIYEHAHRIAEEASIAQAPLVLEMEGVFDMFCEAQKMYAKATYKNRKYDQSPGDLITDSKGRLKLEVKGMSPARRDNCKWMRETHYNTILNIMEKKGYYACVHYVLERVRDMYAGMFDLSEFVVSKSLSANYKSETATMKVFSDEMSKEGLTLAAGQRHEFVVLAVPGVTSVAKRMMLLECYDPKKHKLDYNYYFANLLKKKIDNTITAQYGTLPEMKGVSLRILGKDITGEKPCRLIAAFIKEKGSLDVLDQGMFKVGRLIERNERRRKRGEKEIAVA
ncbi:DNA polymerase family B [uncultured virus]|nr:DNA polymerase family B [uncultured virus]